MDLCGKLILYSVLKMPKKNKVTTEVHQKNETLIDSLLAEENSLSHRMYTCKALVARGDAKGYQSVVDLI